MVATAHDIMTDVVIWVIAILVILAIGGCGASDEAKPFGSSQTGGMGVLARGKDDGGMGGQGGGMGGVAGQIEGSGGMGGMGGGGGQAYDGRGCPVLPANEGCVWSDFHGMACCLSP